MKVQGTSKMVCVKLDTKSEADKIQSAFTCATLPDRADEFYLDTSDIDIDDPENAALVESVFGNEVWEDIADSVVLFHS